jgi:peptide/nickel transport system permease protein
MRIIRRLLEAIVLLLAVGTIVFFLEHLVPGDPAVAILGGASAHPTAEAVHAVRQQYGFDRPLLAQYGSFLLGLVRLDFGESYTLKQPVLAVIAGQIGPTLALTVTALGMAWVLSIASTLATAGRRGVWGRIGSAAETIAAGLPQFWLGLVLLLVFAVRLHWFPVIGTGVLGLVLPALTLAIPLAGFLGQVTRDEFEDRIRQPFVLSARSRGMSEQAVRARHVLRHAALPGITLSGWGLGSLVSGAVIAEVVFARQGIGQVLVTAVNSQDLPLVIGITFVVALVYVVANLLTDIAYVAVDPRLRTTIGAPA